MDGSGLIAAPFEHMIAGADRPLPAGRGPFTSPWCISRARPGVQRRRPRNEIRGRRTRVLQCASAWLLRHLSAAALDLKIRAFFAGALLAGLRHRQLHIAIVTLTDENVAFAYLHQSILLLASREGLSQSILGLSSSISFDAWPGVSSREIAPSSFSLAAACFAGS